jgi:RimJ/RimL family protein N-acetyltransferase/L-amino acid N-acyltransferase YncA
MRNINTITLRPADPERDFKQIDALFSLEQGEPESEANLKEDYEIHKPRIFCLTVAEDEVGKLYGFNWATRSRFCEDEAYFFVIVKPELRGQGAGSLLYANVEQSARFSRIKNLQVSIHDTPTEYRAFAERRGFVAHSHFIELELDLDTFDDQSYDSIIAKLEDSGFRFTTMEELGNTEDAQSKLYILNDSTAVDVPGSNGEHPWLSFEDFQKKVCQMYWYKPDGQFVAIDTSTEAWAAMCAITRYQGANYANTLHIGVDTHYRDRKLGQAVRVLALRYARDVLKVHSVRTTHNAMNLPALAIDRKLGYIQISGSLSMKKRLE